MSNLFEYNYTVLLPAILDLDALLMNHPITVDKHVGNPYKIRDRAAFVLSSLINSTYSAFNKKKIKSVGEPVGLCSTILQEVVRDYNLYLDYFVEVGVLEKVEEGSYGVSCTTYRFIDYDIEKTKRYVIYDRVFLQSIFRRRKSATTIAKYRWLYDNLLRLTVDWDEAERILAKLFKDDETRKDIHRERLHCFENPAKATFKETKTERLSTTLSNLRKELRAALRFDGKRLVGVDISNSVPFFTLVLFDDKLMDELGIKSLIKNINSNLNSTTFPFPWLMLVDLEGRSIKYPDIDWYSKLVEANELYPLLKKEWNTRLGKKYTRNQVKKKLQSIFNSPFHYDCKEREVLVDLFPNVMSIIKQLNQGYWKTKNGHGKSKWKKGDQVCPYAHITQIIEARAVLNHVCGFIESDRPDTPILTVHDCIYTTEDHLEYVIQAMEDRIFQMVGRIPAYTIKNQ
jgi:hypothetical protein